MQPLRIDGFLNATVFGLQGQLYALGRRKMQGALAVCALHPTPRHVAEVALPSGHVLEDPRFLGLWQGLAVFVAADAHEYFSGAGGCRIYQVIVYLDPGTWKVTRIWRLESGAGCTVEKNWVPLGDIDAEGKSRLLYQHDTRVCVMLDHAAQTQTWQRPDTPEEEKTQAGEDVVGPPLCAEGPPSCSSSQGYG